MVHHSSFCPSTHPPSGAPPMYHARPPPYAVPGQFEPEFEYVTLLSRKMTPINMMTRPHVRYPVPELPHVGRPSVLSESVPRNEPSPPVNGYSEPLSGGPPHPTYEGPYPQDPVSRPPWLHPRISVGYDTSQRTSVDPSPSSDSSEYVQRYSVRSTNEQYPPFFRPHPSPGPMPGAWPPSQGPADVQNISEPEGSYSKVFLNAPFCASV